jgi:hypothetical protein
MFTGFLPPSHFIKSVVVFVITVVCLGSIAGTHHKVRAANTFPIEITSGIDGGVPNPIGQVFFTVAKQVDYQGGPVLLSGKSDGTGTTVVDDAIRIRVTHADGSTAVFEHKYASPAFPLCGGPYPERADPKDLSSYFKTGVNIVVIELYDICGVHQSAESLWLSQGNAGNTTFDLNLLFHGIGKGGDNRNPNGGGNPDPAHKTRSVVVDVYDFDQNPIVQEKQGEVTYDPVSGSYKGSVVMGTTLQAQAYTIRVKLSHSLRKNISRNIVAGTNNVIPVMSLVNGDSNNDAKLDIEDYNIIQGCYSDFDLPPVDCNATKKIQADIDDDGKVNQFDMNLFLREMSVQAL